MAEKPERASGLAGWVTVEQAALLKGVTRKAVYNRVRDGRLPHSLIGNTVIIRRTELDKWEVNRNIQAAHRETWRKKKENQ